MMINLKHVMIGNSNKGNKGFFSVKLQLELNWCIIKILVQGSCVHCPWHCRQNVVATINKVFSLLLPRLLFSEKGLSVAYEILHGDLTEEEK